MRPSESWAETAEAYRDFAASARGASACFEAWALAVAGDEEVRAWLEELPAAKRQPNLVFAAARWHGVPAPGPYAALREALLNDRGAIRRTIRQRSTQTNEVGRLATLLPVFALIADQCGTPLSLVEAGASAGLCLYPDRYDYVWSAGALTGSGGPVLRCTTSGPVPVPARHPQVARRAGVDLRPLPVDDDEQMAWLATLVWPEQEDRRTRLRAAVAIARADRPLLRRGDLLEDLPDLVRQAADAGPVVVFHSAVVAYLDPPARRRFVTMMKNLVREGSCRWVSNEGAQVLPELEPPSSAAAAPGEPSFVLALDGEPLALTHGHGSSMTWLE